VVWACSAAAATPLAVLTPGNDANRATGEEMASLGPPLATEHHLPRTPSPSPLTDPGERRPDTVGKTVIERMFDTFIEHPGSTDVKGTVPTRTDPADRR
jgi:hypothetical protein